MGSKIKQIIGTVLLSILCCFCGLVYLGSVLNLNIYKQSYQNPLEAQATVTKHTKETDSDGYVTYSAYISYRVDGTDYTDILYKESTQEENLPAVNSVFTLALNPEDPTQQLEDLAEPVMTCIFATLGAYSISMLIRKFHRRNLTRNELSVIDLETALRDMRALILGRFFRPFTFFNSLSLLFLRVNYPMVFGRGYMIAGVILLCLWLICLRNAVRQSSCIANEEFRPTKGLHIYKDVHVDPKTGIHSNVIHYSLGETRWARIVSSHVYQHIRTGFSISSVELNCSRGKPFLRYDNNGSARGF